MRTRHLIAVYALLSATAPLMAGPWSNPAGTCTDFDWANGQNGPEDIFGSPTNLGDTIAFVGLEFAAAVPPGSTVTISDTMQVDLMAHEGLHFASISWPIYGDYSITGDDGLVLAAMTMTVETLDGRPVALFSDGFQLDVAGSSGGAVPWNGSVEIDMEFASPPVTDLHLTVTMIVTASTGNDRGTAAISAQFSNPLGVALVPEPTTLPLLCLGAAAVCRRSRR